MFGLVASAAASVVFGAATTFAQAMAGRFMVCARPDACVVTVLLMLLLSGVRGAGWGVEWEHGPHARARGGRHR